MGSRPARIGWPSRFPRPGPRLGSPATGTSFAGVQGREVPMAGKAVVSLTTGLEDSERVTVAYLVAVGAAEQGRPTLMFLTKEAVRLAVGGTAVGVACEGCPPLADLVKRYEAAGGQYYVCPICFDAKHLSHAALVGAAEIQGTVPLWE